MLSSRDASVIREEWPTPWLRLIGTVSDPGIMPEYNSCINLSIAYEHCDDTQPTGLRSMPQACPLGSNLADGTNDNHTRQAPTLSG